MREALHQKLSHGGRCTRAPGNIKRRLAPLNYREANICTSPWFKSATFVGYEIVFKTGEGGFSAPLSPVDFFWRVAGIA